MIQNIKSALIGLTKEFGPDEQSSVLGYGLALARQADADITVMAASVKLVLASAWVGGFATNLVGAENRRLHALAEAAARDAQSGAADAGVACAAYSPQLTYHDLLTAFTAEARVHDLSILDADPDPAGLDRGLIEQILIQSGRPLIVVPRGRDTFAANRITVAWDGSAAATRAIHDALPFLRAAEAVEVVSVTGEKDLPGSADGIVKQLARHRVRATARSVPVGTGGVAQVLRESAGLFRSDLIVMGGFVHTRLREMVFGGVTNSLLKQSDVPLFMAH